MKIFYFFIALFLFVFLLSKCEGNETSEYTSETEPKRELTIEEKKAADKKSSEELQARLLAEETVKKEADLEEKKFLKSRAGKIYKRHPEWSKEDCKRLADGRIWIGMTYSMLKYSNGLPNHANPSNYGHGTQWQWCWDDITPSCYYDHNDDGIIDSYN